MSTSDYTTAHIQPVKGHGHDHDNGRNHLLSKNPLTTLCGIFKPGGHDLAVHEAELCRRCADKANNVRAKNRPMPNNLVGVQRAVTEVKP